MACCNFHRACQYSRAALAARQASRRFDRSCPFLAVSVIGSAVGRSSSIRRHDARTSGVGARLGRLAGFFPNSGMTLFADEFRGGVLTRGSARVIWIVLLGGSG
jgi:hypothetical protein